ncbi:hypothetical protein DL764_003136 [Monosporascus ibericus]|uniref:Importin N-terminal domain-containing protein n=1 Tax=Monosporascus ibericus TaxID=155417 RepID=A0A4Q4THT3_9PEZI|nr:hypothetical protein DL764_003136 [Monosporascus ibericus]
MAPTIPELDQVVQTFYEGRGEQQNAAQTALNQFKEDPDSWLLVDKILSEAQYPETKYLGLQILDSVIQTRWKVLPRDQCQGIRNFVVNYIIQISTTEESLKAQRTLLNKLNLVLVSILKQEWPHNWPTFINEIIAACRSNLSICENNMIILRLLSEEVFDYSAEQMTSTKTRNLKTTMCNEFSQIFQLCQEILTTANQASLVKATLETLLRFCNWIPLGYIFETPLIETLRTRFLEVPEFRNVTLQVFTEIGGLATSGPGQPNAYSEQLVKMFVEVLTTISTIVPLDLDLKSTYPNSNSRDQEFIQNMALFLCNFFGQHVDLVEKLPNRDFLTHGHFYLIRISQIDDREIFKICLDYWLKLVQELYEEMQTAPMQEMNPLMNMGASAGGAPNPAMLGGMLHLRMHKYKEVLSNLRVVMIEKMVRPEEVLIVENDEGEIVREFVKESDTVQLYKTIRECLVYLTHLDVVDTETIMTEKLQRQVDGSEWSWHNCNVLCWAIGSISLAMNEETEKRFLVTVIKDLLGLTEMKRGKDNKAVVASNIMYIVGQYPRFLKAHWKFLKTVVNKLFEFMHESHEGVQDMACDTFIKIARQCRRHFVALQPSETEPFIEEIVRNLQRITSDLTPQQVHTFYEACGYMVAAQGNKHQQERLLADLMAAPNAAWDEIIRAATQDPTILQDADTIKVIGDIAPRMPKVRGLRTIKKEILKLVETYVEKAEDLQAVRQQMVPQLLDSVLVDYNRNVPGARDAEVLKAMSVIITKLTGLMEDQVPVIMQNIFECTLEMINKDFSEFPEHRVEFFNLLRAINLHCFPALLKLDNRQFKFVIDACMWASKHDNRDVEGAGLNMCLELITNIAEKTDVQTANAFFQQFFVPILQDVFFVLTDPDHKAGFKTQSMLLMRMFYFVLPADGTTPKIQGPVYTNEAPAGTSNKDFLAEFVGQLLRNAFPNLQLAQIEAFIQCLFTLNSSYEKFRLNVRDFLISLKEFAGDNADLFVVEKEQEARDKLTAEHERRAKVGGLLKPSEIEDDEL